MSGNGGNFSLLRDGVFLQYGVGKFAGTGVSDEGAYVLMGSMIHLIEDQASMPHGANVHHGKCTTTVLSTLFPGLFSSDKFENPGDKQAVSLAKILGNVDTTVAYSRSLAVTQGLVPSYTSASNGGARLWLTNTDLQRAGDTTKSSTLYSGDPSQDPEGAFGGAYGGANHTDIYSDSEQFGLYGQQGQQATDFAFFFLKKMSESMPPQTAQLTINGSATGPAIINAQTGSDISFLVNENRTQNVKVSLFIKEAPSKAVVTDGATLILADIGNPNGEIQSRTLSGAQNWTANQVALYQTNPNNLALLPYKTQFHVPWKGIVAGGDGAPLTDGTYTLCLNVLDGDGNNSSSAPDLCDTSVKILIDTSTISVFDANKNPIPPGSITSSSATIYVSGNLNTRSLKVDGPNSFNKAVFVSPVTPSGEFDHLPDGAYVASALDINNVLVASQTFTIYTDTFSVFDANDRDIPDAGYTGSSVVFVAGPAGTTSITLVGIVSDTLVYTSTEMPVAEFDNLPDGFYYTAANNTAGIISSQTFIVQLEPLVTMSQGGVVIQNGGMSIAPNLAVTAVSFNATITDIALSNANGPVKDQAFSTALASVTYGGLPSGDYSINAADVNGRVTTVHFTVAGPPIVDLGDMYAGYSGLAAVGTAPSMLQIGTTTVLGFQVLRPAPLKSAAITGPSGPLPIAFVGGGTGKINLDPNDLSGYPLDRQLFGSVVLPAAGPYTAVFTDVLGHQTIAPFVSTNLDATLDTTSRAEFDAKAGKFSWSVFLDATSSIGLGEATQYISTAGVVSGRVLESRPVSGTSASLPFVSRSGVLVSSDALNVELLDKDGNWLQYNLNMNAGSVANSTGQIAAGSLGLVRFDPTLDGESPGNGAALNGVSLTQLKGGTTVLILTGQSGAYITPTYDVLASSSLPGSVLLLGPWSFPPDPNSDPNVPSGQIPTSSTFPVAVTGYTINGTVPGPFRIVPGQGLFTAMLIARTGDQPGGLQPTTLFDGFLTSGAVVPPHSIWTAKRYVQLELDLQSPAANGAIDPQFCAQINAGNPTVCDLAFNVAPYVSQFGNAMYGLRTLLFYGPGAGAQFQAGPNQSADFGYGMSVSGMNVLVPGRLLASASAGEAPPGYNNVPPNTVISLTASPDGPGHMVSGSLDAKFSAASFHLTAAQMSHIKVVTIDPGLLSAPLPSTVDLINQSVSVSVNLDDGAPLTLAALAPIQQNPNVLQSDGFSLTYDNQLNPSPISLSAADPAAAPVKDVLARALAVGLKPIGPIEQITASASSLSGIVSLQAPYAAIPPPGSPTPQLYQLIPGSAPKRLTDQFSYYMNPFISANVSQVNSYFGVFGQTPPVALDSTPPVTSLAFAGASTTTVSGAVLVSTDALVHLSAVDPTVSGATTSGVAHSYYLVDQPFVSLSVSPPSSSATPFSLAFGSHTVTYFSVDNMGNLEKPHVSAVNALNADNVPPVTQLVVLGSSVTDSAGIVFFSSSVLVGLSAFDPRVSSAVASGVATTYFLLDSYPVPGVYTGPLTISSGPHVLTYYSVDRVGNAEAPHSTALNVGGVPFLALGTGGLSLGLDGANLLWSIAFDSGSVALAHNDVNGVFTASSALAGGDRAFPWSIFFDNAGSAYALGAAIGANGADQLAVYKADAAGDRIVSAQRFDSGYNNNNFVFGAAAPGWLVGAVQTQGPIGRNKPGPRRFSAAIWKFDPGASLIRVATTTTRAGMDVATGVALDGAGNLWVAGFSYSPHPRSARPFDLALWEYAPDGHTLLAGPFIREGYLAKFDTSMRARVVYSRGTVYVAAPRGRGASGSDVALVAFNAANGNVVAESAWRPADLSSVYPSALLQDGFGKLLAAGSFDYGDGTVAGLWRYGSSGALTSAAQAAAGGADGAALRGANLWLAVDGSTSPFLDNAENAAPGALSDIEPPRTALAAGTPSALTNLRYATKVTTFGFVAADDAIAAGDGLGVGAAQTFFAVDSSSFSVFSNTFTLVAEGTHTVSFFSSDIEGNAEVVKSTTVGVDLTAPVVTLVSSGTLYALQAQDPVVNGAASGVALVRYLVDVEPRSCDKVSPSTATAPPGTCANLSYAGPFSLAVGTHTVYFNAVDNVGNGQNVISSSRVVVGSWLPPALAFTPVGGSVLTTAQPTLAAVYSARGSGLNIPSFRLTLDGVDVTSRTVVSLSSASFVPAAALSQGTHTATATIADVAGDVATASSTFLLDSIPPQTEFLVGAPQFSATTLFIATATPIGFSVSEPARTFLALDSSTFAAVSGTFTLVALGTHTVEFYSVDLAGNVEITRSSSVAVDGLPPVTQLVIAAPSVAQASATVVGPATVLSLTAQDPLSGGASGVKDTFLAVSTGVFALAPATFTLTGADGARLLSFYSRDNVINVGAVKTTSVLLDATPPVSTAAIGAPSYVAADGTLYVTPATPVTLSAADPVVNGAAAGMDRIEVAVDSAPFAVYLATLTFAEGRHTVQYRAVDRVGNVETAHVLKLQSDATAPVTALQASGAYYAAAGRNYAPLSFIYALPAQDPVVSGVTSGVAAVSYRVDASSFSRYASTFSLTEGIRRVDFQSADNVANQELLKSATVYVDATAPVTALTISRPRYAAPGGTLFVGPATAFSLSARDPVVLGAASGVSAVSVRVDSAAYSLYNATFTLTAVDGLRTVGWFAADNVGNTETPKVSTVALDATPPLTSLLVAGGRQYPGPDASTFYASSDTRLVLVSTDPVTNGVASGVTFTRWQDNNGVFSMYLSSLTLAEGAHKFGSQSSDNVANLEVLRSTNVWVDATPPVTAVSIGSPTYTAADGTIYVATATLISFTAADPALPSGQPGSGVNRIETSLDGAPFTPYSAALTLAEGRHVIAYRAVDNVGNAEPARSIALQSDATPPVSALVVGAPQFRLQNVLLVSSRTPFSVAVLDPVTNNVASGVKDTYYRVSDVSPSTAAFAAFAAPFALAGADVNKVVEFFSRDNVLNTEISKSSTVLLDSTPPELALLSPAACDSGICRVLKGKLSVLGTARDLHFGNYVLDYAPGRNAAAGFTTISSGAVAVSSGMLGAWDATKLSGWLTLRLTASDLVQNVSMLALDVFVGDPGELLRLGNHEVFDMPGGVAVGADGKIYVADRDNSRIAVFSSTGTPLASFGGRGHDDDERLSTGTLRLNNPSGVAADAAGDIYVADTLNDRVLKLSATGQVLLTLGGRPREPEGEHAGRHEDRDEHGRRRPGRFHHPAGVAVDAARNIYVADTDNRRVQVFGSTGAFRLQFDLPPVPSRPERDEDDRDEHEDAGIAALGKPYAIALDAAGAIYVADPKGARALKFGATGQLLRTIPIAGDKPGSLGQPFGVAVNGSGDCLLVSDRKFSRVLKFDFQGGRNLSFGVKGRIGDDDAPAPSGSIVFRKPMGLALDAAGNLFVADRNNDRVREFALPTGRAPLVVPPPTPEDEHSARDVVDKEDGGKVERRDLAAVDIPAGAVARDLKVTVSTPSAGTSDESSRRHAADAVQLKAASPPVEYGPEGTKFARPVTLTLPYSPDLVALEGVGEADLTVRYWNRDKAQWENLDSKVDPKTHTITAKTLHFSLYQVFSGTASAAALLPLAAGDPTFAFHDAYAFPNPVRDTSAVTIRMQTGLADSVSVHAYDVTGRRVYSSSNFTLNTGLDDGNGKGSQYTYDNVWDISGVGSGMYTYVLTAKKAGAADIHKSGRIGVVK